MKRVRDNWIEIGIFGRIVMLRIARRLSKREASAFVDNRASGREIRSNQSKSFGNSFKGLIS